MAVSAKSGQTGKWIGQSTTDHEIVKIKRLKFYAEEIQRKLNFFLIKTKDGSAYSKTLITTTQSTTDHKKDEKQGLALKLQLKHQGGTVFRPIHFSFTSLRDGYRCATQWLITRICPKLFIFQSLPKCKRWL